MLCLHLLQSLIASLKLCQSWFTGLDDRGGGGGGCLRMACVGAIGVCNENACVYSSSSDDEGEDESGESEGESKGFVWRPRSKFCISEIGMTPPGWSEPSHQAVSSELGGGRPPGSAGNIVFASFSSNFSPGSVATTLSSSSRDNVARLILSIIRISALNRANTGL